MIDRHAAHVPIHRRAEAFLDRPFPDHTPNPEAHVAELRAVYCPDCGRHFTARIGAFWKATGSVKHVTCAACGVGSAPR